jgi:hypothetical protein
MRCRDVPRAAHRALRINASRKALKGRPAVPVYGKTLCGGTSIW